MSTEEIERLIPAADTEALGLGVGRRSIGRYIKNPARRFSHSTPDQLCRPYFRRAELEAYKQRLIQRALSECGVGTARAAPVKEGVKHAP